MVEGKVTQAGGPECGCHSPILKGGWGLLPITQVWIQSDYKFSGHHMHSRFSERLCLRGVGQK